MEEKESSLIERMKRVEYFKKLSTRDIAMIIRTGEFIRKKEDQTIFYEDAPCYGLCVLLRGEVHLSKLGREGQENIIAVIRPVIMFNEVSAIDGLPNPVTAVAVRNSLIWRVDCESFHKGLALFPKLGLGLLPVLARRNRRMIVKYADLSFHSVRERVAILLLELSRLGRKEIDRRENTIQQLAAHVATNPVVISRTLGEFRDLDLVECSRSKIVVLNPDELAKLASIDLYQSDYINLED